MPPKRERAPTTDWLPPTTPEDRELHNDRLRELMEEVRPKIQTILQEIIKHVIKKKLKEEGKDPKTYVAEA